MLYQDFVVGNKTYKLRLNTRNIVELEKAIGCNPLSIFEEDKLPEVTTMVKVLHYSLQALEHGISINDSFDIFDAYLDDGHAITDFIQVILDVYKVSGILKEETAAEASKNMTMEK